MICSDCQKDKPLEAFSKAKRKCKACRAKSRRDYYADNKELVVSQINKYKQDNPDKVKDRVRKWQVNNVDKMRSYSTKSNIKRAADSSKRFRNALGTSVYLSLKSGKQGKKSFDLLGYTLSDLKESLSSKFKEGMNWDNYGQWQVDHIRPLASYGKLEIGTEEFRQAWSLGNLQPLWARENQSKGGRYER